MRQLTNDFRVAELFFPMLAEEQKVILATEGQQRNVNNVVAIGGRGEGDDVMSMK